ncbi:MAG: hypothetical protein KAI53_01855 [Candidatus Aenigmarchaeota archaeon]|nr:hypothetical protein [Candidatus Aenigmarchaeota archaeon]
MVYNEGFIVPRGRTTTSQPFCIVTLDETQASLEFHPEVVACSGGFQYLNQTGNNGDKRRPVKTKIVDDLYVNAVKEFGRKFGILPFGS